MRTGIVWALLGTFAVVLFVCAATIALSASDTLTATVVPSSINPGGSDFAIAAGIQAAPGHAEQYVPTKDATLKFDRNSLPEGVCVESWALRLYVKTPGTASQDIRVFRSTEASSVSDATVFPRDIMVEFNHKVADKDQCEWLKDDANLGLKLQSKSPKVEYQYFGLNGSCACLIQSCASRACNKQPRLIVRYRLNADTLVAGQANWPQNRYDAQQSGRTEWRTSPDLRDPGDPKPRTSYAKSTRDPASSAYLKLPLIYNDRLLLATQQISDKKDSITEMDNAGRTIWQSFLPAAPKFSFLDLQHHLYVVTEKNELCILNAETGLDAQTAASPEKSCKKLEELIGTKDASVQNAPTVGTGGAIYLPTKQGLFALTKYPNLKVLWRYKDQTGVGTVALNSAETSAYIVDQTDTTAPKLVALDTADGMIRWQAGIHSTARVPIVGPGSENGEDRVYVATDQDFATFADKVTGLGAECERRTEQPTSDPRQQGTTRQECWKQLCASVEEPLKNECQTLSARSRATLNLMPGSAFSQPVLGSEGYVYYVKQSSKGANGQFCRTEKTEKNGSDQCFGNSVPIDPVTQNPTPGLSSFPWNAQSMLAADGRGNVYIVDPVSSPQNVLKYVPQGQAITNGKLYLLLRVPPSPPGGEKSTNFATSNFLVGPDGTLYNANDNYLFAIGPKALTDNLSLNQAQAPSANNTAFLVRGTIAVESTFRLSKWSNVILEAGNGINFQRGFSVPLGAQLSCRIQPTLK